MKNNLIPPEVIQKWKKSGVNTKELDAVVVTCASYCVDNLNTYPGKEVSIFVAMEIGACLYQELLFAGLDTNVMVELNDRLLQSFQAHLNKNK